MEGVDDLLRAAAVHVVAVEAADPVAEEGTAAHAFGVGEEVEGSCAVGLAGGVLAF